METIADQYYLKAMNSYPLQLAEAVENLNYALSYDAEHVGANHLMGRLYMEVICDYGLAEHYYKKAMAGDPTNHDLCLDYALLLITTRELDKARNLLDYVKKFRGIDLARAYHHEGLLYEYQYEYNRAIQYYEYAMLESYNEQNGKYLKSEIQRVEAKQGFRKRPPKVR